MFEKERFIEECRAALKEPDTHAAVRELVARAVTNHAIGSSARRTRRAAVETIYKAEDLTILNFAGDPR